MPRLPGSRLDAITIHAGIVIGGWQLRIGPQADLRRSAESVGSWSAYRSKTNCGAAQSSPRTSALMVPRGLRARRPSFKVAERAQTLLDHLVVFRTQRRRLVLVGQHLAEHVRHVTADGREPGALDPLLDALEQRRRNIDRGRIGIVRTIHRSLLAGQPAK